MAKYTAITRIKYGKMVGSGEDTKAVFTEFEPGDLVTGLPSDTMKELWDAGVLTKVEEPVEVPVEVPQVPTE